MEGVNIENSPTVQMDSNDLEEDIFTSSYRRSSGANEHNCGGNERKINKDAIYTFMRFPRDFAIETVFPVTSSGHASILTSDVEFPSFAGLIHTDLLENLVSLTSDIAAKTDNKVSIKQMKAALYTNILLRVAYTAAETRFLDCSSFRLLDKIFKEFASFFRNMKDEVNTTEEQESKQYKFNTRTIKIDNIVGIDISTGSMLSNEICSGWQEYLSEEGFTNKTKIDAGDEALEDECNFLHESVLKDIIHIHNSIFGSEDLVRSPGSFKISEADRLSLFEDSYSVGVKMIKSLEGTLPYSLDAKLCPEHLLHLSLDSMRNLILSHKPTRVYNFYKDSNDTFMAKMRELLVILKEHILVPMTESNDHSDYQKILDVINLILGMPLSTPLAKALMALQFLLNRVQIMRETVLKSSHSDQLEPILSLVLSWKKLEFESWTALLDEVQSQYEINAGKLWLPLYSILQSTQPATLKSLKKFMRKSNIGEFRKRLQLIFAMHGQIKTGISQRFYSSPSHAEFEKSLYYIFGLHLQFLPLILKHINDGRKSIELELKAFVEGCRWEQSDAYLTDSSKKVRRVFKGIIQKYNNLLQQPLKTILKQEAARRGMLIKTVQDSSPRVCFNQNVNILTAVLNEPHFSDKDPSAWISIWKTETDAAIKNLKVVRPTNSCFLDSSEITRIMESVSSPSLFSRYQEERKEVCGTIRKIYESVIRCRYNWNEERLSATMRWALSRILIVLDKCGLSNPTSSFCKNKKRSYNMQHLLLTDGTTSVNNNEKIQASLLHSLETEWRSSNQYFFKSISSFRQLKRIRKTPHKDFTPQQVWKSLVHLYSLIAIQQEQRAAAYDFASRLEILKKSMLPLENLFSSSDPLASDSSSFPKNQHATFNCMWQQKQLFDCLCALLHDISLLLRTVDSSDLDTCQKVVTRLLPLVEESVPHFQKSKDLLDNYLLGKDRIITSVEVQLQPNGVTKQMEQFVHQNFSIIKEFKERMYAFRKQDVNPGSAAEILFGHLESFFIKEKIIFEEYKTALQAGNCPEHTDEDSDPFVSGFVQALEQTYRGIADSFTEFDSSNSFSVTEKSLEKICTWKAIFESNISSLKFQEISDGLAKTIQFAGDIVNRNISDKPGDAADLKNLYSLLRQTLAFGRGLLFDFLVMHRAVSQISDDLMKLFGLLYSQGFPICLEEQHPLCTYREPLGWGRVNIDRIFGKSNKRKNDVSNDE